jgi:hypothetical protein
MAPASPSDPGSSAQPAQPPTPSATPGALPDAMTPLHGESAEVSTSTARRLQAGVAEGVETSKRFAKDRLQDFLAETPYFQAKVALVAAYVVIVLLTILIAPPADESIIITQRRINFGLSFKAAVEVHNLDEGDLEGVIVEAFGRAVEFDGKEKRGAWRTKRMDIFEGDKRVVLTEQLFDNEGVPAAYSLIPERVRIIDDDGDLLFDMVPRPDDAKKK